MQLMTIVAMGGPVGRGVALESDGCNGIYASSVQRGGHDETVGSISARDLIHDQTEFPEVIGGHDFTSALKLNALSVR